MATRIEQLTARMTSADYVTTDFYGMVYGDIGTGKTVWAARLAQAITPEDKGILFLDTRRGFSALNDHPDLKQNMMRVDISEPDDLTAMAQAILGGVEPWAYIGTIIIDELNVLAADNLVTVVRDRLGIPLDRALTSVPEWPDYNANQNIVSSAVTALTNIDGINVIAVSGNKATKDNQGIEKHRADISPGLSKILTRDMHLVARMEASMQKTAPEAPAAYVRTLQANPTVRIEAKTRLSGLPIKVNDDTLIDTIAQWLGDPAAMREDLTSSEQAEVPDDEPVGTETGAPVAESDDEVFSAPMDE
jgi:hypothetical protein